MKNYELVEKDIYQSQVFSKLNDRFDIIFLDPPFKDKNLKYLFNEIQKNKILKDDGIIILHRHKNEINNIPLNFNLVEEKIYGISKIIFLSHSE